METGIIYRAYNKVTGKSYIGQTKKNLSSRIHLHYRDALRTKKDGSYKNHWKFCRALRKYKCDDWVWYEVYKDIPLKDMLDLAEMCAIYTYDAVGDGYNCTFGGEDNPMRHERYRKMLSVPNKKKGRPGRKKDEDHKRKISESNKGKRCSEKTKRLLSAAAKKRFSDKTNHPAWGRPCSAATRLKISESNKGRIPSTETRRKMSQSQQGKHCLEKHPQWGVRHDLEYKNQMALKCGGKAFEVYRDGVFVGNWVSQKQCARDLDIFDSHISNCLKGRYRQHKGYTFKYTDEDLS